LDQYLSATRGISTVFADAGIARDGPLAVFRDTDAVRSSRKLSFSAKCSAISSARTFVFSPDFLLQIFDSFLVGSIATRPMEAVAQLAFGTSKTVKELACLRIWREGRFQ